MFTWLIEHILAGVPIWVWPMTAVTGLVIYKLTDLIVKIPGLVEYKFLIQPIAAIIMIGGVFMWGGSGVTALYQIAVTEAKTEHERLQGLVEVSEKKAREATGTIVIKYKEKLVEIKESDEQIQARVKASAAKMDLLCKIEHNTIGILNDAARKPVKKLP